jgi:hypothetical protein
MPISRAPPRQPHHPARPGFVHRDDVHAARNIGGTFGSRRFAEAVEVASGSEFLGALDEIACDRGSLDCAKLGETAGYPAQITFVDAYRPGYCSLARWRSMNRMFGIIRSGQNWG